MLWLLFHGGAGTAVPLQAPSALLQAGSSPAPSLPREVCKEINSKVYNLSSFYLNTQRSGCSGKEKRQKQEWQNRGGSFTPPAGSQKSGRVWKRQGCVELAAWCSILTVWEEIGLPYNSVKEAFVQKEAKMPQQRMTWLSLEINKIFLTWTNRTSYSGRDGRGCGDIDVGFSLGFLLGEIPIGLVLMHFHTRTRKNTPWAGLWELGCPVHITYSRMSYGPSSLISSQESKLEGGNFQQAHHHKEMQCLDTYLGAVQNSE